MKAQTTIGYYQKNGVITELKSDSNQYYDSEIKKWFKAEIVPLEEIQTATDNSWHINANTKNHPDILNHLFKNQSIFVTTNKTNMPYALLMYTQVEDPKMSRTGTLLKKKENDYKPVIYTHQNQEYLIELKGAGCPLGGFPGVHFRVQSGTATGYHLRITGGLAQTGAIEEYENLITALPKKQKHEKTQVFPLAYKPFVIEQNEVALNMAILIRLSPSTIRYSFSKNSAFDNLFEKNEKRILKTLGRELACLLDGESPQIHQNINPNNLLFLNSDTFILTDYEECPKIQSYLCNLDILNTIIPPRFWNLKQNSFEVFLNTFSNTNPQFKEEIENNKIKNLESFNKIIMRKLSDVIIKKRIRYPEKNRSLKNNLHFIKTFMPKSYYQIPIENWITEKLIPELNLKLKINQFYLSFQKKYNFETLKECWNDTCENAIIQSEFNATLLAINKSIKLIWNASKNYHLSWINQYVSYDRLLSIYTNVPEEPSLLKAQFNQLTIIQTEIQKYEKLKSFDIPTHCLSYNWEEKRIAQFGHFISLAFPFIPFLMVYFENELNLLESCNLKNESFTQEEQFLIKQSLTEINEKLSLLKKAPEIFQKRLLENEKSFINFATLSYMKGLKK